MCANFTIDFCVFLTNCCASMSLADEFQVCLPSNVAGHPENRAGQYETTLACPLELDGSWEVGLIDISFPHTWINVHKEILVGVSVGWQEGQGTEADRQLVLSTSKNERLIAGLRGAGAVTYEGASNPTNLKTEFYVKHTFVIEAGQYEIGGLVKFLQEQMRKAAGVGDVTVRYDAESNRVRIADNNKPIMISCMRRASLFSLLGFAKRMSRLTQQTTVRESDNTVEITRKLGDVEWLTLEDGKVLESTVAPRLKPINSLYIYSDISDYVMVGNSQAPLLGILPVQSKWGDQAYWNFNPAYYVRVKQANIRTIALRVCDETGETVHFESGHVICRLNFRRVGYGGRSLL
jgi:hypothetical protein